MKEFLYLKELLNFSNLNYNDIKKFFISSEGGTLKLNQE